MSDRTGVGGSEVGVRSDGVRAGSVDLRSHLRRILNLDLRTAYWLIVAAVLAYLLLLTAYQVRPTISVNIGDTPHDTPLVHDFYPQEQQSAADGGRRFRWTRDESTIVFPGIGRDGLAIDLSLSGSNNPHPDTNILANDVAIATLHLTPDFRTYRVAVPASAMRSGSLELTFATTPFTPRGDRRALGIVVERVTIHPVSNGFVLPPTRMLLSFWFGALCAGLGILLAGFGGAAAFAGTAGIAASMAAFLVWNRMFLTVDADGVVRAGLLLLVVIASIRLIVPPVCRRLGLLTRGRDVRWLALIVGFTLALRYFGVLHPDMVIGDLTFHLHRFEDVVDKHLFILPVESKEAGGRTILYAPTPYLVMAPLSWLVHDRRTMFFFFGFGIDAIRFCILWYVARRVTGDFRAANLVVVVMALVPIGWIVYSWGIFANMFAELMLTILFALLILAYDRLDGPHRWRWCAVFACVICVTLLTHDGVLVLTALVVTLFLVARIVQNIRRRARPWAGGVLTFALAGLIAAAVAFALFYRIPARDLLAGRHLTPVEREATATAQAPTAHTYRTGGATPDAPNGLRAITTTHLSVALALETWETSFAFYRVWPVVACLIGIVLLWRTTRKAEDSLLADLVPSPDAPGEGDGAGTADGDRHVRTVRTARNVALTLTVWLLVAAIMLVVGIVLRLYVRYPLFALPAIALGAGIVLASLVRRGRWGIGLVLVLLTISCLYLAFFWYNRIVYDWKIPT